VFERDLTPAFTRGGSSVTISRMSSSVRLSVALVLGLVAAGGVQASASTHAVTPSAAQAKHATRLEVMTRYTVLAAHARPLHPVTLNVGCGRLRQRLYRCSFFGETVGTDQHEYVISGRSMVRFDKRVHVRLYNLSCTRYNLSTPTTIDFGC
jgi:hypothetical protein